MSAATGLALRVLRRVVPALALVAVFTLTSVVAVVVHLDTTAGRRLVSGMTSTLVSDVLLAGLRIERIEVLSPRRLLVSRATLVDRLGKPVLVAEGLDVRFGLRSLLQGIFAADAVRVAIPDVRAERLAVSLTQDPERGGLTLETAFDLRTPSAPGSTSKPVFVSLPRIVVGSAAVATNLKGLEPVTAKVGALAAGLELSPRGLVISLKSDDARVSKLFAEPVTGRLDSELRFPGATRALFDAKVGAAPITATLGWSGSELDLGLRSGALEPAAMSKVVSGWPLVVPLRASAQAVGPPTGMTASAQGSVGKTQVSARGSLRLTPEVASDFSAHVQALDLRAFDPDAPETALDVDAQLSLRVGDEGLTVTGSATLGESTLGGHRVPPLTVRVSYARQRLTGTVTVLDPKLSTEGDFVVSPDGKLELTTQSKALELEALAAYGVSAQGKASLRTKSVLEGNRLATTFDASLSALRVGGVAAQQASIHGRIEGPLKKADEQALELTLEGKGFEAGDLKLGRFRAVSKGSMARQSVVVEGSSEPGIALDGSADVSLTGAPTLSDVRLASRNGGSLVEVSAKRVTLEPGNLSVDALSLRAGDGSVVGSIAARGGRRLVSVTITDLELSRVAAALGLPARGLSGLLNGHVELEEAGDQRTGLAILELRDGALPPVEGVTAHLSAEFDRSEIELSADLGLSTVGTAKLTATGALHRSVLEPRALRELTGQATLAFSELDLEQASRLWLADSGVLLAGRAGGKLGVQRASAAGTPTFSYQVQTHGLSLARPRTDAGPASEIHLDIDSVGELVAAGGSRLALRFVDAEGQWLAVDVEHSLAAAGLADALDEGLTDAILNAPWTARVTAYRRPMSMLGAGASALQGSVAGTADVTGSARAPEIDASISVSGPRDGPAANGQLDISLEYSAAREEYRLKARSPSEKDHVELSSTGHFGWLEHGLGKGFTAKGEARVSALELSRFGRLLDVPIQGEARGSCRFDIAAPKLEAEGDLVLERLSIGQQAIGSGSGRLRIANGRGEATLGIEQGGSTLEVVGDSGVSWKGDVPELDTQRPGMLRVTAHDYELASVAGFARGVATRVTGKLNGRAEVNWGSSAGSNGHATTLRANATVRDGTASLVAGGGLIQSIEAQALADGDGPLRLTFSGAARSRKPNIKGTATLSLDGPRLKRLNAKLDADGFPLLYDGILMGRATTSATGPKLEVSIVAGDAGQTVVDISVPSVEIKLPEANDKSLITLDDDHSIEVQGGASDPDEALRAANAASTTTLKVRLGQHVVVKRDILEVPVGGALTVAPDGRLTGTITLRPGGIVPGVGQIFRITHGVVTFKNQEVKDGTLAIEASTRVADGTLVELSVRGSLSDPDLTLRSDPPRSENEIVALLLGIQTDTTTNSGSDQLGRTAMALAMNRLLEGSALSSLQFGAGETTEGEAVSTVSVRVGSKVWLEGRSVKGSDTSVNPNERMSGVVDWRFAPSWSLRSQLGNITGIELRWSFRY